MNANEARDFPAARPRLPLAAFAGALAVVAAIFLMPGGFWPAYRLAVFACLGPAVGSLLFLLIHRLTGGRWQVELEPFLVAGARLAPWIGLLALPLIPRAGEAPAWPAYDSAGMRIVRAVIYTVILFLVAEPLAGKHRRQPAAWFGPLGLIVMVFMLHLLAEDCLEILEPGFHSTAFALVWMSGMAAAGLACAVLMALVRGREPQIAWGNLLMTAVLFWCYVAFAQFLIVWSGNLPGEISWYLHRTEGAWGLLPPLLGIIHFALPFGVLLSRHNKRSAHLLGAAAAMVLFGQLVFMAWIILPVSPTSAAWVAVPLVFTFAVVFMHCYIAAVRLVENAP